MRAPVKPAAYYNAIYLSCLTECFKPLGYICVSHGPCVILANSGPPTTPLWSVVVTTPRACRTDYQTPTSLSKRLSDSNQSGVAHLFAIVLHSTTMQN